MRPVWQAEDVMSGPRVSGRPVSPLAEPLRNVVGKTAEALGKMGMTTVGDLLRHYPRRYAERGELTDLVSLRDGEHVTVLARIASVTTRDMRYRKGKLTEVTVTDGHGMLTLTFFKQAWREKDLKPGRQGLFAGKVSTYRTARTVKRQLTHPDYEILDDHETARGEDVAADYAAQLIPVYPATQDVSSWKIAAAVRVVLDTLGDLDDPLPEEVRGRHGLAGLREAFRMIHRPADWGEIQRAEKRLKWDEAFVLQAALAQRRRAADALPAAPRPHTGTGLLAEFLRRLPFTLTDGQRAAAETIAAELGRPHPMHRLLQGEVGAGKTVVAVQAMLQVVDAGGQAALLAPTEVLAQQHYRSITGLLGPLAEAGQLGGAEHATRVALLTGSQPAAARRQALADAASGAAGIVVGTHALLQEHVQFADLGLVVVDEQHRFGVEQRDALREKAPAGRPHVLVMTATPIPRTVAMTVYGDLDVATLTELPAGRPPIATHVVPAAEKPHFLERSWERVREEGGRGQQAYVVCPRIGGEGAPSSGRTANAQPADSDGAPEYLEPGDDGSPGPVPAWARPATAVTDLAPELERGPLKGLRIGVLHGGLHPDEKDRVMRAFAAGTVDVLVATTVVEVGVDVPNASVMVVMDADRFGVSQLHQLRGRVGRGSAGGLCLLVTAAPPGTTARERLDALAATLDGFQLSRLDLEQRREGDVLGEAQHGRRSSLKKLTLLGDESLIGEARAEAAALVDADPELDRHPALASALTDLLGPERAEYLEKA
jgi:ATP-dependent DNA helicase RecG